MTKGDMVYYARIMPKLNIYDLLDLKVGTVYDDCLVAVEAKTKQRFLFFNNQIDKQAFSNRNTALEIVKEAAKNKRTEKEELYYEEY